MTTNLRELADAIINQIKNPHEHPVRWGTVVNIDPITAMIQVLIQPEGEVTDFITYLGLGMAFGPWTAVALPMMGAEVLLLATGLEGQGYIALGSTYNGIDNPLIVPPYQMGQVIFQHTLTGRQLVLDLDGTIYLGGKIDPFDLSPAHAVVFDRWITDFFNPLVAKVNAAIAKLNAHTHTCPAGGSSPPVGAPAQPGAPWDPVVALDVSSAFKGV